SRWSCNTWSPKALTNPRTLMTASLSRPPAISSDPYDREKDGEPGIEHDDEEDGLDDRSGRQLADACGIALDLEAFEAANQPDDEGKNRRLDHADHEGVDADRFLELAHEHRDGDPKVEVAHHRAANEAHDVGVEGQKRQGDHEAEDPWQHQR